MDKTPQQRGKSNRTKGARVEREIVAMLQEAGIPASKSSRSGYSVHDIDVTDEFLAEVKARGDAEGFKLVQRWIGEKDMLFLKSNYKKPVVVLDFDLFTKLMAAYLRH